MMNKRNFAIFVDNRQKTGKHPEVDELARRGHEMISCRLPVGDYCVVSSKYKKIQNLRMNEDYMNLITRNNNKDTSSRVFSDDVLGTYSVAIDTKRSFLELGGNLLLGAYGNRYRFERELQRAQNMNIKLYIVIADDDFKSFWDLLEYKGLNNIEGYGKRMLDRMTEFQRKYGCSFVLANSTNLADVIENYLMQESDICDDEFILCS